MFEKCEYVISAVTEKQYPNKENRPEFVFFGRSNVGKSSLINALTGKKLLAKVSSKPGKTVCLNFFNIDDKFYFVDVPGYGYAIRSQEQRQSFGSYIEEYLKKSKNVKIAFLLVDTKVGPTKDDILMYEYLKHFDIKTVILATKSDKVGKTKVLQYKKTIYTKLNCESNDIIMTSSLEKKGIDEVVSLISSLI